MAGARRTACASRTSRLYTSRSPEAKPGPAAGEAEETEAVEDDEAARVVLPLPSLSRRMRVGDSSGRRAGASFPYCRYGL